ncbi:GPI-GlcNAc transferase complex, PIG-H component-domain-containing protein [Triangularia setosa]|uniref:GPI-GlcNAc transferase complex, PIG-H component-domain-containing protein n=1 Tax=Triangularia setosa TaxID=2587417 RepID=A0AAN6WE47_9PEZI|nr:GPI-GlcNAc transferase complex, PIG-H component-domain-containing protein [Podospora setosa]
MLTTAPHLYLRRPSPTTAEFTVTTCPPLTIPLRICLLTISLLRAAIFAAAITTIYSRFFHEPSHPSPITSVPVADLLYQGDLLLLASHLLQALHSSPPGQFLASITQPLSNSGLAVIASVITYFSLFTQLHTTESLLVLRGLGIQTSTSSSSFSSPIPNTSDGSNRWRGWKWWFWGTTPTKTRFIPTEKIRDVLINEAFRGFEVRYYLIVIVEGEEDIVVVFPRLLPGRKIVEEVWRGVRGCLYEGDPNHQSLGGSWGQTGTIGRKDN